MIAQCLRFCKRSSVWNFVFWRNIHRDHELRTFWKIVPHERALRVLDLRNSVFCSFYLREIGWRTTGGSSNSVNILVCRFHSFLVQDLAWVFQVIICMRRWLKNIAWHPPSGLGFRVLYSETTIFLQIIIANAPYGILYHLPRLATLPPRTAPWGPHCGRRVWASSNSRTHAIPQRSWPPQLAVVSPASCYSHVLELTASEAQ